MEKIGWRVRRRSLSPERHLFTSKFPVSVSCLIIVQLIIINNNRFFTYYYKKIILQKCGFHSSFTGNQRFFSINPRIDVTRRVYWSTLIHSSTKNPLRFTLIVISRNNLFSPPAAVAHSQLRNGPRDVTPRLFSEITSQPFF